jgi:hypothetical protein
MSKTVVHDEREIEEQGIWFVFFLLRKIPTMDAEGVARQKKIVLVDNRQDFLLHYYWFGSFSHKSPAASTSGFNHVVARGIALTAA